MYNDPVKMTRDEFIEAYPYETWVGRRKRARDEDRDPVVSEHTAKRIAEDTYRSREAVVSLVMGAVYDAMGRIGVQALPAHFDVILDYRIRELQEQTAEDAAMQAFFKNADERQRNFNLGFGELLKGLVSGDMKLDGTEPAVRMMAAMGGHPFPEPKE